MVEAIVTNTPQHNLTPTAPKRKHFWHGSKLPSIGCMITVFSYYDYRSEVKSLLTQMNKAGRIFFYAHLDNMASIEMRKLSYPEVKTNLSIRIVDKTIVEKLWFHTNIRMANMINNSPHYFDVDGSKTISNDFLVFLEKTLDNSAYMFKELHLPS